MVEALDREEQEAHARKLQRLADDDVIRTLQFRNFDTSTPEWVAFASALAEYGYSVFVGWLHTGSVYRMAANFRNGKGVHGLNKLPEDLQLTGDEAHALAADLIVKSIQSFRTRTLMNSDPSKRWRVDGGASIKTFFINRCLMELPDQYKQWSRREGSDAPRPVERDVDSVDHAAGPEARALDSAHLNDLLGDVDPIVQMMFRLRSSDYTYEETAELLTAAGYPHTTDQVRTKLYRHRSLLKNVNR